MNVTADDKTWMLYIFNDASMNTVIFNFLLESSTSLPQHGMSDISDNFEDLDSFIY